MRLVDIKPPHIAAALLLVSVGLHFLLPQAYRRQFACLPCGVVAIGLGIGLVMWVMMLFRLSGTASNPTEQATALVTSGPFCFSRNPMYLGVIVILLGISLWVGSLPMLIAPIGFFCVPVAVLHSSRRAAAMHDIWPHLRGIHKESA
jgi:protein-S-isoprenylcysteine O-methyltransferase Ste14